MSPLLIGAPRRTTGFWARLAEHGDRPALTTPDGTLTYGALAGRVRDLADRLGSTRRLVLLAGANDVDAVVGYLAALRGGHPVILVPGDNAGNFEAVRAAYDPDVVLADGVLDERRPGTAHDLHPDLALLLSTSGSTGSPKLVRLSHENLESNAVAICDYLGIRSDDVAATTLPMHYCYGLSVINSHLAAGATLLLTDLSVVDACFWDLVREHGVITFAGVPYTFELLDRVGFAGMDLPSLRYLTQAGGRLAPQRVRQYAELGRRRGWDLFVMYGQTEATARMAYLPPDLAAASPTAIGVPVPGGSFSLAPLPELPLEWTGAAREGAEVGELVYEGANVMLGYATSPADLARGRDVGALRTGDVARRTPDGLYEVIGRRNRFAKVFGLRIDLDQVEQVYAGEGAVVYCADGGERLVVAVDTSARPADPSALHAIAKEHFGLPPRAVEVLALTDVPRLPSGKPDYRSIAAEGRSRRAREASSAGTSALSTPNECNLNGRCEAVRDVFAGVLVRPDATERDTFVSLAGDSLSYVEMSIRLEEVLGDLPAGWHVTPIAELARSAVAPDQHRRGRILETNVLLRALAIVMIVGTHANLFAIVGGAHVLLGVAGFNFGRFHVTDTPRRTRVRHLLTSVSRVVVPSVLWLAAVAVTTRDIGWSNVLLLNAVVGPRSWTEPQWWYWFVEALVAILLVLTAALAVPWVDRLERRATFWLPFGLALAGLLTRYDLVELAGGDEIHRASVVFWLFALGWATVKSTLRWQRVLVTATVVLTVPGFFGDPAREAIVMAGMLLLVWLRAVRVPDRLARAAGVLAAASLYIYLAHWQIYPYLEDRLPLLATVLGLAGGVAFWQLCSWLGPALTERLSRTSPWCRATHRPACSAPTPGRAGTPRTAPSSRPRGTPTASSAASAPRSRR